MYVYFYFFHQIFQLWIFITQQTLAIDLKSESQAVKMCYTYQLCLLKLDESFEGKEDFPSFQM
jgi:hypothetical protein